LVAGWQQILSWLAGWLGLLACWLYGLAGWLYLLVFLLDGTVAEHAGLLLNDFPVSLSA